MSAKKIRLKVASDKLAEVIGLLFPDAEEVRICILQKECTPEDIVFTVYLEESKRTFTLLAVTESIHDWEFGTEDDEIKIASTNPKPVILGSHRDKNIQDAINKFMDVPLKPENQEPSDIVKDLDIKTFNELATLVEAIWTVGLKSPGLIMKSVLCSKKIKEVYGEVANSPVSIDHALLKMVIENYYSGDTSVSEAAEDVIAKLEKLWRSMSSYASISSIAQALFRK